jgi:hypothetical protein
MRTLSWQATLLLLALVGAVTTSFLLVFYRDGIGSAIWTALVFGAIIALIAGIIVRQLQLAARVDELTTALNTERTRAETYLAHEDRASKRVEAVLAHADPSLIENLKKSYPTLFAP